MKSGFKIMPEKDFYHQSGRYTLFRFTEIKRTLQDNTLYILISNRIARRKSDESRCYGWW